MTGFSSTTIELEAGSLALELRSVNHRYLDLQLRLPDELRQLEPAMREQIASRISRGKVECRITHTPRAAASQANRLNLPVLQQLAQWSDEIRHTLPAARELSVAEILRWHGIFESVNDETSALHQQVLTLLQQALTEFTATRAREGEKLKQFIKLRTEQINTLRLTLAPRIPAAIKIHEEKLRTRLLEALGNLDDERIRQEITLFSNRIDVDEELSRLHTHLSEVERILDKGGIVGKRLDFLMQELHREANTLGSKSVDAEVSRASLDMKILIEQMREQVQNLE